MTDREELDAVTVWRSAPLQSLRPPATHMHSRWILRPDEHANTSSMGMMEWELRSAGWQDRHPHDEINYVLEGELHVEADGVSAVLHPGDCTRIAKGSVGRYWAPAYARMIAVYGPNTRHLPTDSVRYWDIPGPAS